jgi:hypothetical protein
MKTKRIITFFAMTCLLASCGPKPVSLIFDTDVPGAKKPGRRYRTNAPVHTDMYGAGKDLYKQIFSCKFAAQT